MDRQGRTRSISPDVVRAPLREEGSVNLQTALSNSHLMAGTHPGRMMLVATVSSLMWMMVSSWLIVINKRLLSGGFGYPMALSGLGMAFSGLASYIVCRVLRIVEAKRVMTYRFYVMRIMPIGLLMALTLLFGNLSYLYLTVAFIQILKAFTPVITMGALFLAGLETPTARLVASVVVIAIGTAIAAAGELNFSLLGVIIMMLSEVFEAARLVLTQKLLTGLRFHPIEGLMYLAPATTAWLFVGSVFLELPSMLRSGAFIVVATKPITFCFAAALGFGVNSMAYIVIQTSSSLTLKVLGTAKNAIVVLLGIVLFQEKVSATQGVGYGISAAAFFWYQQIKMQQVRGKPPPPPESGASEKGMQNDREKP